MKKNYNHIRIVVPAYNTDETIEKCVEAICDAAYCFAEWELIIVDNGLNEDLDKLSEKHQLKIIHRSKKHSAAYARNEGAEGFLEGILIFIDSDVIVEKECLNFLIQPIVEQDEVAAIGNYSKNVKGLNFAQAYKQLYINFMYGKVNNVIQNDFWTAIAAIDAATFHRLNGFDCSFMGANGEDQEFGIRLTQNNYSVISASEARGKHLNPYSIKKIIQNDFRKGLTAMSNSFNNNVPLKDNRHANLKSIVAVFFAGLSIVSMVFSIFNWWFLFATVSLFFIWMGCRSNLLSNFLEIKGINFAIKSLLLAFILDLVRCWAVIIGLSKRYHLTGLRKNVFFDYD